MDVLSKNCDRLNRWLRVKYVPVFACAWLVTSVVSADPTQPAGSPPPTPATTQPVILQPVTPTPTPKPMHPVTPTAKRAEYAKDVLIDWAALQVEVSARVAQTDLPIELLLCAEGTKEHESILVTGAQPKKIYEALGLIGASVGTPVSLDPATGKLTAASGQALDIEVAYDVDGKTVRRGAHEWMVDSKDKKPIAPLNWVFCGSRTEGGMFGADADGTIACVVDFSTALIGLAETHSASDSELWVLADKNRVPKQGTPCTVIIRPVKKTPPPATTPVAMSSTPAAAGEVMELLLTPEGFFQHGDDILDALSLDGLIKERIKTNPDQKVSLTAMQVEPEGVEKMNLFTRLAGRAIIGSGINQKNLTMKLLDEPEKKDTEKSDAATKDAEKKAAGEKAEASPKPSASPAPSPTPTPLPVPVSSPSPAPSPAPAGEPKNP